MVEDWILGEVRLAHQYDSPTVNNSVVDENRRHLVIAALAEFGIAMDRKLFGKGISIFLRFLEWSDAANRNSFDAFFICRAVAGFQVCCTTKTYRFSSALR